MLCNIWLITIFIIIIFIIGLILFSQNKESFNISTPTSTSTPTPTPTFTLTATPTPTATSQTLLDISNIIVKNNNKINTLLNQLSNTNTNVQLINYDPNTVYYDMQNNITSNIATINNNLSSSYTSKIDTTTQNINQLEHSIDDLDNIITNLTLNNLSTNKYNTIKSLNNGLELKLLTTPNTTFKNNKTGENMSGYMVMANDGCLSVGATDYDIYKCNDKNPKQLFNMEHILNETAYQNNIDTALPADNTNKSQINYPFVMMKSINNENCLTNNHGNLTVQPCYSFTAQRWFPL